MKEISELDAAIAAIERIVSHAGGERSWHAPNLNLAGGVMGTGLGARAFSGMTTQQAITKCLRMAGHPLTTRQIAETLQDGGFATKSKKPYAIIYNTLLRLCSADGPFERQGDGTWSLRAA